MRVLQLVDSLDTGGTERVAVNIANALSSRIEVSVLCATRKEGILKKSLKSQVKYAFLEKKKTIDFKALVTLKKLVKKEKISIIHAHSSSFFMAVLLKFVYPRIKIIWHDHYGNNEFINQRKAKVLIRFSSQFNHVLCVNERLKNWGKEKLKCKDVDYIPNFAIPSNNIPITTLKGNRGKRIMHLANLRPQKDHETLLRAFAEIIKDHNDWTLHCVGKDFNDPYSDAIKVLVRELRLNNKVFFYGGIPDVTHVLNQADIAVLSSKSEGLPIALLEYGFAKLPVVVTNVGDCLKVVSNEKEGYVVEKQNHEALKSNIIKIIKSPELRLSLGLNLFHKVNTSFSEEAIIKELINIYKLHLK
ncbi:glycosyltransferase family 4 protein [Seonamhaeicola marinus]|uniref:Glycosyltransferase family 4 protein n=1 Tax=Seonamhaeicola marinus TaxID=1912246 RepID=A0A5D0HJ53_9FLAO|nr:glycosyltransferase family 4 protein [Seonamhaeicola marinus]TYA71434.1 glycosyltransferase family 4 protein [Seonamhaeicola marinus]